MNREQEKRFFNQIEKVLHDHNDSYQIGAWEEFEAHRSKSKRSWGVYRWLSAAVILLMASFGLFELVKMNEVKNLPLVVTTTPKKISSSLDSVNKANSNLPIANDIEIKDEQVIHSKVSLPFNPISLVDLINEDSIIKQSTVPKAVALIENITADKQVAKIENIRTKIPVHSAPEYAGAYDDMINNKSAIQPSEKINNKLTYSLVVSPSVGNEKINLGAGVGLLFALNPNFSISTGLLYTALNASSDGKSFINSSISVSQSAHLSLTGLELPLGIQYQTKGGFYAAAGISALGVFKNELEYKFLEEKTVSSIDVSSGTATEVFTVVSELKTEKSVEPLNNYVGFFNFSAGKKQAFGKVNLNIGPFVKVPFTSVSAERIKLVQAGVKLSFDF